MKARRFILRCASFVLLLVFSQKVGVGLFLHNLLHNQDTSRPLQSSSKEGAKEISYACNCIDDFLMPFTGSEEPVIVAPLVSHEAPLSFFRTDIPFRSAFHPSLRGPPVMIL